jgi:hypothetical protein
MTTKKPKRQGNKQQAEGITAKYRRISGRRSGQTLIDVLAASPLRDVDFGPAPYTVPVRDVKL